MAATKTKKRVALPASARFEYFEPIGTGGMGTVYRARDRRTDEYVAIKVLNERLSENPNLHARLVREFKSAHALEHPNIVRALAFENDGEVSFAVFELVEGCSLGQRLDAKGRFPEAEAIRIITQVAQALHYAHQRKVIHRDVKPDNILLLPDGRAKLTDFGLAKDFSDTNDPDLTRQASGLGTPYFMAPEQFADAKNAGVLCDVYSLAATLYNLLTGELPFDAKFPLAILTKKQAGELRPVRACGASVSTRVELAIRAGVDPNPAKRPQSALDFFKMLTAGKGKLKTTAAPTAPPARPTHENRRAWARIPLAVGTCAVVEAGVHSDGDVESWPIVMTDVSAGGMGLLMARRFEPGTQLAIDVSAKPDAPPQRLTFRVIRVQKAQDGHWRHGCSFLQPLTNNELLFVLSLS